MKKSKPQIAFHFLPPSLLSHFFPPFPLSHFLISLYLSVYLFSSLPLSSSCCPIAEGPNYCSLQVWTINGRLVKKIGVEENVHSLVYSAAPEGVYVNILAGGLANGNIK